MDLDSPFVKMALVKGTTGATEEREVTKAKIVGDKVELTTTKEGVAIFSVTDVSAILPKLPNTEIVYQLKDVDEAIRMLESLPAKLKQRSEASTETLQKWKTLRKPAEEADAKRREEQKKAQEEKLKQEEAKIRQAAREQVEVEIAVKEAEKSRQIDLAKGKVSNYLEFQTRQEIEEATQACDKLDKSDLTKIQDYEKASEYWRRCLALPVDVAMPGKLDSQNESTLALAIDPSASGSALMALAWALLFVTLVTSLHGLTRFLALLQDRDWVGAGIWLGVGGAAGICLYLFFLSERGSDVELGSGGSTEMRAVRVALGNAKEKEVTRFAEKIEIPSRIFLQQIVGSMKNPDPGSKAWVPRLTRFPAVGGDSEIEIGVEVPLKWISLPVRVSFAAPWPPLTRDISGPLPDQEVSLKVTGGKIGPFSVGAERGAWIWEQIVPAYQGVVTGLGLDQGVRLIPVNSEKVVVSIPEVRAKLKPSP